VRAGQFRLDLYHRLQVVELVLPPLRARPEDVPLLARHFLSQLAEEHGRALIVDADAMDALCRAGWPGNVRQLRNVLERIVVSHPSGRVTAAELAGYLDAQGPLFAVDPGPAPPLELPPEPPPPPGEEERVLQALARAGHVQARAARLLGMTVRQLRYRIAKYGIAVERF
jgi:Nif-specific regulatory protein